MTDARIYRNARQEIVRVSVTDNLGPLATTARPTAASAGVGTRYYDTTLNKPAWSDGTNWRDATGAIV